MDYRQSNCVPPYRRRNRPSVKCPREVVCTNDRVRRYGIDTYRSLTLVLVHQWCSASRFDYNRIAFACAFRIRKTALHESSFEFAIWSRCLRKWLNAFNISIWSVSRRKWFKSTPWITPRKVELHLLFNSAVGSDTCNRSCVYHRSFSARMNSHQCRGYSSSRYILAHEQMISIQEIRIGPRAIPWNVWRHDLTQE